MPIYLFLLGFAPRAVCAQSGVSDSAQTVSRKQPPQRPAPNRTMNFNGRKMPRREGNFSAIGIKVDETEDFFTVSIFFNDALDSNSVEAHHIFINETPLPPKTEFLFNKNRHMLRFTTQKADGNFTLKLSEIRSCDGKEMRPTEVSGLEGKSFFKFSPKEQKWQKTPENRQF